MSDRPSEKIPARELAPGLEVRHQGEIMEVTSSGPPWWDDTKKKWMVDVELDSHRAVLVVPADKLVGIYYDEDDEP